jgi:hypothetical protein
MTCVVDRGAGAASGARRGAMFSMEQEMDEKLKRRMLFFYIGGVINGLIGFYVLIQGDAFLAPDTKRILVLVFLLFAALDFYFPYAMKKKWLAENTGRPSPGGDGNAP